MDYYHIRTYTPFCGEEADVYISAKTEAEYILKATNAANENGMEWFEAPDWCEDYADRDDAIDDYYAQCGWRFICPKCKREIKVKDFDIIEKYEEYKYKIDKDTVLGKETPPSTSLIIPVAARSGTYDKWMSGPAAHLTIKYYADQGIDITSLQKI